MFTVIAMGIRKKKEKTAYTDNEMAIALPNQLMTSVWETKPGLDCDTCVFVVLDLPWKLDH